MRFFCGQKFPHKYGTCGASFLQFKKVTGLTPTSFKQRELHKKRLTLEEVGLVSVR